MLWAPALAVAATLALHLGRVRRDFADLLALSLTFTLVFFLCRAWLSESNVVLALAPALILGALGRIDRRLFTALWAIALAFTVANASPLFLLWAVSPGFTEHALAVARGHADVTIADTRRPGGRLADRRVVDRGRVPAAAACRRSRGGGAQFRRSAGPAGAGIAGPARGALP